MLLVLTLVGVVKNNRKGEREIPHHASRMDNAFFEELPFILFILFAKEKWLPSGK